MQKYPSPSTENAAATGDLDLTDDVVIRGGTVYDGSGDAPIAAATAPLLYARVRTFIQIRCTGPLSRRAARRGATTRASWVWWTSSARGDRSAQ